MENPTPSHFSSNHHGFPSFRSPIYIQPLNIANKSLHSSSVKTTPSKPSTPVTQNTPMTTQSMLEGNVRILCDMVDNVLKGSMESENNKPPCIITSMVSMSKNCSEQSTTISPSIKFSPKTSSLIKPHTFLMEDNNAISQLNQDSLLNMFPMPPPRVKSTQLSNPITATPTIDERPQTSSRLGDSLQQPKPRKSTQNRSWVITSGLFLTPPAEDGQKSSFSVIPGVTRLNDVTLDWDQMNENKVDHYPQIPCHPLSPTSPLSRSESPVSCHELDTSRSITPDMEADLESPSVSCPSSAVTTPTSSHGHLDPLSQHLLNIETQLRRPSFLMSERRVSMLSALFASNAVSPTTEKCSQQELFTELSLAVGSTAAPSKGDEILKRLNNPSQQSKDTAQELDWRAWHGVWNRRKMKQNSNNSPSSPKSLPARSSITSTTSTISNIASIWSLPSSPISLKAPNRMSRKFSAPAVLSSTNVSGACPIKDADPELWECEGQKWGDRFQMLVHNFQSSAGKHSKKLADILPMNRWNRRSRLQSTSEAEKSHK
ncbi:hypothetical protein BGZ76_007451 [Entomortierella beljakovae]|nr:hypothetical protein BGZ76_007451 [Entomortierella beljakovae]